MHENDQKTLSLQDVMNQMAQNGIAADLDDATALRISSDRQLSELDAFIELDPLLATLHKEYRSAKADRQNVVEMFGVNDPMAEIALDKEDSAWCAMQTRYLELRHESETMREAQRLMLAQEEEAIADAVLEQQREKERIAQKLRYFQQLTETAERNNAPSYIVELWYVFLYLPRQFENMFQAQRLSYA